MGAIPTDGESLELYWVFRPRQLAKFIRQDIERRTALRLGGLDKWIQSGLLKFGINARSLSDAPFPTRTATSVKKAVPTRSLVSER